VTLGPSSPVANRSGVHWYYCTLPDCHQAVRSSCMGIVARRLLFLRSAALAFGYRNAVAFISSVCSERKTCFRTLCQYPTFLFWQLGGLPGEQISLLIPSSHPSLPAFPPPFFSNPAITAFPLSGSSQGRTVIHLHISPQIPSFTNFCSHHGAAGRDRSDCYSPD
jgi:hypothetical protein